MMACEIICQRVCLMLISVRTCNMLNVVYIYIFESNLKKQKKKKQSKRKTDSNKTFFKTNQFLARHGDSLLHKTAGNCVCGVTEDNLCSFLLFSRARCGEVRKAALQKSLSRPPWVLSLSRSILSLTLFLFYDFICDLLKIENISELVSLT